MMLKTIIDCITKEILEVNLTEKEIYEMQEMQDANEPSEVHLVDILKERNATLEKALLEMAEVQSKEYENRKILENAVLDLANTIAGGK